MQRRTIILSAAIAAAVFNAAAESKLDGPSKIIADSYKILRENPSAKAIIPDNMSRDYVPTGRGTTIAGAIVKANEGTTAADFGRLGLEVISNTDDMYLLSGDMNDLLELAESNLISLMSLGQECQPYLEKARAATNVNDVHNGTGLEQPYKGSGVICGIFDSGMDINHLNFMNADRTATRVKTFYHFNGASGGSITYGTPERIATFTTDKRSSTHGTHTLGCMSGSFNSRPSTASGISGSYSFLASDEATMSSTTANRKFPYYGTAPEADIVAAAGELYNANITGAVDRIVTYARNAGQPVVVNLSIGTITGPRDGSDATTQYLTRLSKDAIIVISAGNDADHKNSIAKTFSAGDNTVKTFLGASGTASGSLDMWARDSRAFKFTPAIVNINTGEIVYKYDVIEPTNGTVTISTSNYSSEYIHEPAMDNAFASGYFSFTASVNSANNRYNVFLSYSFTPNATLNSDGHLAPAVIVEGVTGQHVDFGNNSNNCNLSSRNLSGFSDGNGDMSINNIACAKNTIAVGAYTTSRRWPTMGRSVYHYTDPSYIANHICNFSSYGITADGRSLPQVVAPGAAILSSYSKYYYDSQGLGNTNICALYTWKNRDHHWGAEQGTSMSAPVAAGIIALWLQANPELTPDDIIETFKHSSFRPSESIGDNDTAWGYGSIDALNGLKYILSGSSVADITADVKQPIVTASDNVYEIFVAGADKLSATVYNLSGQPVRNASANTENLTIDLNGLASGIYILSLDNSGFSRRIVLK